MLGPLCKVQECGRGRNPFAVKKYCLGETARSGRAAPKGFVSPDIVAGRISLQQYHNMVLHSERGVKQKAWSCEQGLV